MGSRALRSCYRDEAGEAAVRAWCSERIAAWAVPSTVARFDAAGSATVTLTAGSGPETVVVVAGDRFCAATNLRLLESLVDRFRVVAADVPGQPGLSADRPGAAHLDWYGRWLSDVLARTGPALVLGHSFGGAIALACSDPLMRGRLAVSTGGLCRLRVTPAVLLEFTRWSLAPGPSSSARMLRRLLGDGSEPPAELVEWMTLVARAARPISVDDRVHPRRAIPTSIATGAQDVFVPPSRLRPAARAATDQELRVIPNAGHLVTEQAPHALRDLLEELAARPCT